MISTMGSWVRPEPAGLRYCLYRYIDGMTCCFTPVQQVIVVGALCNHEIRLYVNYDICLFVFMIEMNYFYTRMYAMSDGGVGICMQDFNFSTQIMSNLLVLMNSIVIFKQ